jgi:hypothetical protein
MKFLSPFTLAICTLIQPTMAESEFTAYLRQEYVDVNGQPQYHDLVVDGDLSGNVNTEQIEGSTRFVLYAMESDIPTGSLIKEHYVNETKVGEYTPEATVSIEAIDSVGGVARTRLDHPFSVSVTTSNLKTDRDDLQQATKEVHFYHAKVEYGPDSLSLDETSIVDSPENPSAVYTENATFSYLSDIYSQIDPGNTELIGEEIFTIVALPDFGFPDTTVIDQKKVLICPITTGQIFGIDPISYQKIPTVSYAINNLYPGNGTAAESAGIESKYGLLCYAGAKKGSISQDFLESNLVTSVPTTGESYPKDVSEKTANMTNIKNTVEDIGGGDITIELVQLTGIGIDRLDSVTFEYNPNVRINANISSSE